MIEITDNIIIDDSELQIDFVQASGPGGQNVNKVATAVQLRFDVLHSRSLPEAIKARLVKLAGKRATAKKYKITPADIEAEFRAVRDSK